MFVEVPFVLSYLPPAISGLLFSLLNDAVDFFPLVLFAGGYLLTYAFRFKFNAFFLTDLFKALLVFFSDFFDKALKAPVLLDFVSLSHALII